MLPREGLFEFLSMLGLILIAFLKLAVVYYVCLIGRLAFLISQLTLRARHKHRCTPAYLLCLQGKFCSHTIQQKCSQLSEVTSWFVDVPTNLDTWGRA